MQAQELEVRSSAAATDAGGPSSSGSHGSSHLAGMEGLSAADRLAILEAMGEQQQQAEVAARDGSPPPRQRQVLAHCSPVRSTSPPQHHQARQYARPPPPPPPRAAVVEEFINLEAQRADKWVVWVLCLFFCFGCACSPCDGRLALLFLLVVVVLTSTGRWRSGSASLNAACTVLSIQVSQLHACTARTSTPACLLRTVQAAFKEALPDRHRPGRCLLLPFQGPATELSPQAAPLTLRRLTSYFSTHTGRS